MTNSPSEWALLITAIFGGISSVVAAWRANQAKNIGVHANEKLDEVKVRAESNQKTLKDIHQLSNGNCQELKEQIRVKEAQVRYLQRFVDELVSQLPVGSIEQARRAIRRRDEDFRRHGDSDDFDPPNTKGDTDGQ